MLAWVEMFCSTHAVVETWRVSSWLTAHDSCKTVFGLPGWSCSFDIFAMLMANLEEKKNKTSVKQKSFLYFRKTSSDFFSFLPDLLSGVAWTFPQPRERFLSREWVLTCFSYTNSNDLWKRRTNIYLFGIHESLGGFSNFLNNFFRAEVFVKLPLWKLFTNWEKRKSWFFLLRRKYVTNELVLLQPIRIKNDSARSSKTDVTIRARGQVEFYSAGSMVTIPFPVFSQLQCFDEHWERICGKTTVLPKKLNVLWSK